jgi:hypothetical protein
MMDSQSEAMEPLAAGDTNVSRAISAKRIADALERITSVEGIINLIGELKPIIEQMDKE